MLFRGLLYLIFLLASFSQPTIWPAPSSITHHDGEEQILINRSLFRWGDLPLDGSGIIQQGVERYERIIFAWGNGSHVDNSINVFVYFCIEDTSRTSLSIDTDESYSITITRDGDDGDDSATINIKLHSKTPFGTLHALETLSHLISFSPISKSYFIEYLVDVTDSPRFPHRGVMIDTGRRFYSTSSIKRIIEGMSYLKLNVLHWHVSDSESMPLKSYTYPKLALYGAFLEDAVYTHDDVKGIIDYAFHRGIRVIPEFDMPTHNYAYKLSQPELFTNCSKTWTDRYLNKDSFDPTLPSVYNFIDNVLGEFLDLLFIDEWVHLGGDEFDPECWNSTPSIVSYMKENNLTDTNDVFRLFESKIFDIAHNKHKKTVVFWDEVYESGADVGDSIVQTWRNGSMESALGDNRKIINSYGYYFTQGLSSGYGGVTFSDVYDKEPIPEGFSSASENFLGAEACMWGVSIDEFNFDQVFFLRGMAFAERMWSFPLNMNINDEGNMSARAMPQRCRLLQRGIKVGPADWGLVNEDMDRRNIYTQCEVWLP